MASPAAARERASPAAHPEGALLPEQGETGALTLPSGVLGAWDRGRLTFVCVYSTTRGPAVSVARPRR
eukprot:3967279-Prymnesium_polylepis.1